MGEATSTLKRETRLRVALAAATVLLGALVFPHFAAAENWQLQGTIPNGGEQIEAVSSDGVVALTRGGQALRWTKASGKQPIGTLSDFNCSFDIVGISDEGVILGTEVCWTNSGTQQNNTLVAWTPQSGNNPITPPGGAGLKAAAIAPNGKFIATDIHGTAFDPTDDTVVTGQANVAPQTGALLAAFTPAGPGVGIDRADDGTTLVSKWTSTDFNVPPTYQRDGSTSGPYPFRGSETYENVFGLLPDERVFARERGSCACEDPPTDFASMHLAAYDGASRTEIPVKAGGMTTRLDQIFLIGGGNKAIYGTGSGGGIPAGDTAIVAWSTPSQLPHALPMIYEAAESGQATVTPRAASKNGAYLVLSNGEVWFDTEWELGIQPEKIVIPDQVKKYAFEQQQHYEERIQYWQQKQKTTVGILGPFAYISPMMLGVLAVGVSGQGMEFTVAIQNRDYWATVSLDPPDPKWKTVASPPRTHIGKLKRPRSISKKDFLKVTSYLGARLAFVANQICAVDAINRGSTAFDKDDESKGKAQYAAGARCSKRAATAARSSKRLAPKAAPVIDRALLRAGSVKGAKKSLTRARWKKQVNWQVRQVTRLIDLPPSLVKQVRAKLSKPARGGRLASIKSGITVAAKHDGGTSGGIGKVGDAFEQAAD